MCLFGTLMWFTEAGNWYPPGHQELLNLGITDRGAFLRDISLTTTPLLDESPFASILHSFWFVIVTVTTVGYGDMYPTTGAGKLIGTLTILCGIIVLAMPVGVIGANFSQEYDCMILQTAKRKKAEQQAQTESEIRARIKDQQRGKHHVTDGDDKPSGDDVEEEEVDEDDDIVLSEDLQMLSE